MFDLSSEALDSYSGDVILYYGPVSRGGYLALTDILKKASNENDKVCVVLVTFGGDPDAGYRVARALNHHYNKVEILIPAYCKSAGTLVCIGAHKLFIGDSGELGPLDIQLSKPDEILGSMSGLDIAQAVVSLEEQVLDSFQRYLMKIHGGSRLRTKLAADIATKLVDGLITPITSKIDPVTYGEHQRAMKIAYDYGIRLSQMTESLSSASLMRLVNGYPSHSFVIDRKEAANLFDIEVVAPGESVKSLCDCGERLATETPYPEQPFVSNLRELVGGNHEAEEHGEDDESEIDESEINEPGGAESVEAVNAEPKRASKKDV